MTILRRTPANHYTWGGACDGWRLLDDPALAVIAESVPPGRGEVEHRHGRAQQFFYILAGQALIEVDGEKFIVAAGEGVHVPAGVPHRFRNESAETVSFLVISEPSTRTDRVDAPLAKKAPC